MVLPKKVFAFGISIAIILMFVLSLDFAYSATPLHCCTEGVWGVPESVCFMTSSTQECEAMNGAVQLCGAEAVGNEGPDYQITEVETYPPNLSIDFYDDSLVGQLIRDIAALKVYQNKYVEGKYNCVDFSSDLEKELTRVGYNASIVFLSIGHTITAVHIDNYTVFVEPQYDPSLKFNNETFVYTPPFLILDYEEKNDSRVGLLWHPNPYPKKMIKTEGRVRISLYGDLLEAIKKGFKFGR